MFDSEFQKDPAEIERVRRWRDAAVADGWSIEQTYPGGESIDRAATLRRNGYQAQILTRDNTGSIRHRNPYNASVSLWGPDRLVIRPPLEYDWSAIQAGLRRCHACGAEDVDTERYSFAGRCCSACRPAMAAKCERPGWDR